MKRNDFILIFAIIFISLLVMIVSFFLRKEGAQVLVMRGGDRIGSYSLLEDQEYIFGTEEQNVLIIKDNKAYISEATCPDKLCVKQRAISTQGESLVCLPHKLIVQVLGGDTSTLDAVSY